MSFLRTKDSKFPRKGGEGGPPPLPLQNTVMAASTGVTGVHVQTFTESTLPPIKLCNSDSLLLFCEVLLKYTVDIP